MKDFIIYVCCGVAILYSYFSFFSPSNAEFFKNKVSSQRQIEESKNIGRELHMTVGDDEYTFNVEKATSLSLKGNQCVEYLLTDDNISRIEVFSDGMVVFYDTKGFPVRSSSGVFNIEVK